MERTDRSKEEVMPLAKEGYPMIIDNSPTNQKGREKKYRQKNSNSPPPNFNKGRRSSFMRMGSVSPHIQSELSLKRSVNDSKHSSDEEGSLEKNKESEGEGEKEEDEEFEYIKLPSDVKESILSGSTDVKKLILKGRKFVLRINDHFRVRWDLFVMCLAAWNCLSIPFQVAFRPAIFEHIMLKVLDSSIDLFFFIDIVVNFRTTFIHSRTGDEESDPKLIAKNYLKGRFWIDLLASLPFDYIAMIFGASDVSTFDLFGLLKLIRIGRLGRIISYLNLRDNVKMLVFFLVLYIHCLACTWYYVCSQDNIWIPPYDYIFGGTSMYEDTIYGRYWSSVYHSILMLTGGEIGPRNTRQVVFCSVFILIGAIITANIFGTMAVILTNLNRKFSRFQEKIDIANTSMKNMKLPVLKIGELTFQVELQSRVINYLMYTQSTLDNQKELNKFLSMISPSLEVEVKRHIFGCVLKENRVFRGEKGMLLDFVIRNLSASIFLPEGVIINQKDIPTNMYFLAKGDVNVFVNHQPVNTLNSGALFGEVALIAKCKRTATVKSLNYSTVAEMKKEAFMEMILRFPQTLEKLKERMKEYKDRQKILQKHILKNVSFMRTITEDTIEEVYYSLKHEFYNKGATIINLNKTTDRIYMIVEGTVEIKLEMPESGDEITLDELGKGSIINTHSFLVQSCTTFLAKAKTPTNVMELKKGRLEKLRNNFEELDKALEWEEKEAKRPEYLPLCDFVRGQSVFKQDYLNVFKRGGTKVMMINRQRNYKPNKWMGLLKKIKEQLAKEEEEEQSQDCSPHGTIHALGKCTGYFSLLEKLKLGSKAPQNYTVTLAMVKQTFSFFLCNFEEVSKVISGQMTSIENLSSTVGDMESELKNIKGIIKDWKGNENCIENNEKIEATEIELIKKEEPLMQSLNIEENLITEEKEKEKEVEEMLNENMEKTSLPGTPHHVITEESIQTSENSRGSKRLKLSRKTSKPPQISSREAERERERIWERHEKMEGEKSRERKNGKAEGSIEKVESEKKEKEREEVMNLYKNGNSNKGIERNKDSNKREYKSKRSLQTKRSDSDECKNVKKNSKCEKTDLNDFSTTRISNVKGIVDNDVSNIENIFGMWDDNFTNSIDKEHSNHPSHRQLHHDHPTNPTNLINGIEEFKSEDESESKSSTDKELPLNQSALESVNSVSMQIPSQLYQENQVFYSDDEDQ